MPQTKYNNFTPALH